MESLQSLATESFSYSWLFNGKSPLNGLADSESPRSSIDEASALEITTFIVHQKILLNEEAQNFKFDLPAANSESALSMVHADEIFSDGQIMPLYINRSKNEALKESRSDSITAPESTLTPTVISQVKKDFIEKWRGLPSRILQKWLRYLKPLFKRLGMSKNTAKVEGWSNSLQASAPQFSKAYSAVDRAGEKQTGNKKNLRKTRSWSNTPQASPLRSPYHSTDDKHDMECLVTEAILHCKRSFGMLDSISS